MPKLRRKWEITGQKLAEFSCEVVGVLGILGLSAAGVCGAELIFRICLMVLEVISGCKVPEVLHLVYLYASLLVVTVFMLVIAYVHIRDMLRAVTVDDDDLNPILPGLEGDESED